ncbi:MAG: hypothetical protein NT169_03620 [Chloroflexi bacterium]|nr:hypothetical protein [Chloroflexota bacterium]
MNQQLHDGLRRIADLVDPQQVRTAERLQKAVWAYEPVERIPVVMHRAVPPDWPLFAQTETFEDPEKMLWNQLREARIGVGVRDDRMMTVRANYGPAILPSLFGATVHVDDATTWVEPCHSSRTIREIVDRGVPDLTGGFGTKVMETEAFFRDTLRNHGLDPYVHLFQANNQGLFDVAYLLWGQEIYFAMRDEPELVHALMDLVTRTTIAFVRRQKEVMGEPPDEMYHWWYRVPAGVRVVDDVTFNLSPAMYAEFCLPYAQRLFANFGGYIHYCGHILKSQELRLGTPGLRGVEMGGEEAWHNPNYTLEKVWRQAAAHRVTICWVGPGLPTGRPAGLDTGLVYGFWEDGLTWEDAPARLAAAQAFWTIRAGG